MAKQLNQLEVNLTFGADTKEAKKAIMELQKSLQAVAKLPGQSSSLFDDVGINKASKAARELEQHLSKAVNVDTGKLDLSRFSSSLKASNKTLTQYCNTLLSTGEVGQKAFLQLAQSIAAADTPTTRINKKLQEMGTTLKNTARWQISSSILHGFMGALQSAYGYAQDLNASLNDIRIVTGYSAEQMEKFAEKANKVAKALSTTTTEYTNASLIYFQQGLSDSEVAARTEVTIKMANAAGVAAEKASDQLTAVWNNFYDGSKSLEYYADVMTALGAATASSTDEISEGLNKFAAVAETVGLSYEYAASALATVTATTRQSADVVGTAFKTLFARLQDLELGETLDDGTTLGKYSVALNAVGINIKDVNGQMKDMDTILDELGGKWQNLSKDTQVALAKTVAGTRQYTQLIALMDNWDYFQQNLGVAKGSTGTLQEQADIYAESWEAAQDRVRAAAENIYQSLLDDDFFIDLLNGFEKALQAVGGLIDGLGGMKGVIMTISSVFMTSFAQKMPTVIENLKQNFMVFTGQAEKEMVKTQNELQLVLQASSVNSTSDSYKVQAEGISKVTEMKKKLIAASKSLTQQERDEYEAKIKAVEGMYAEIDALIKKKEAAEAIQKVNTQNIKKDASKNATNYFEDLASSEAKVTDLQDKATVKGVSNEAFAAYLPMIAEAEEKAKELNLTINNLNTAIEETGQVAKLTDTEMDALMNDSSSENGVIAQKKIQDALATTIKKYQDTTKARVNLDSLSSSVKTQAEQWKKVAKSVEQAKVDKNSKAATKAVDITKQKMQSYLKTLEKIAVDNKIAFNKNLVEELNKEIESLSTGNITKATNLFAQLAQEVETVVSPKITELDADIDKLETNLGYLGTSENGIATLGKDAMETAVAGQQLSDSLSNIGGIADENIKSFTSTSVALTEFASVAMSVSGLINTVKSSLSIIFDEGTSGVEKFGAAVSILSGVMAAYNSVMAFGTTLKKIDTSAETTNALAKVANATKTAVLTIADKALSAAKITETGAVIANTAAWYANPIMWIAVVIMAAVAAVALLVAGIILLSTAESKEAKEAKKMAAASKELAETADEAKQAVEDLKSAFDGYDSAIETLNECVKGTQEWYDALRAVENEVLNIMSKYPELAKNANLFTRDNETGTLMINPSERETLIANAEKHASVTQAASIVGAAMSSDANAKKAYSDLKQMTGETGVGDADMSTGQFQAYLDLSDLLAEHAEELANLPVDEYKEKVKELIEGTSQGAVAYEYQIDALVKQSEKYQDEVNNLITATEEAANQMENAANIIASIELGDEYDAAEKEIASEAYEAAVKESEEAWRKKLTGAGINKWSNSNNAIYEEVLAQLKAAGYDYDKQKSNAIRGNDNNRSFAFIDSEGKEVVRSAEWIAQTIAANEALAALGESAQAAAKAMNTLDAGASEATAAAVKNLITNKNFDNLSQEEMAQVVAEKGDQATADYLANLMGVSKEKVLQMYGVADEAELETLWSKAVDNNKTALANAGTNLLTSAAQDTFNNLSTTKLDPKQKQALADYMNTALVESGDISALTKAYGKVAADQTDEFVDALGGIDWNTATIKDLRKSLKDFGISASFSDEELAHLIDTMGTAEKVYLDYGKVMSIIKDLDKGESISADDFKQLGDEYSEYFRLMADGTYQLTADAAEFYKLVKGNALSKLSDEAEAAYDQAQLTEKVSGYNWNYINSKANSGTIERGQFKWRADNNLVGKQIDFLTAAGYSDEQQLKTWKAALEGDSVTQEMVNTIFEAVQQNAYQWSKMDALKEASMSEAYSKASQYLTGADSLAELDSYLTEIAKKIGNTVPYEMYSEALSMMGLQYENCAEEIEAYEQALISGTTAEIATAEEALKLAISIGELANQYGLDADLLETQASLYQEHYKEMGLSEEAAARLSAQNIRMNEGIETLSSNWEKYHEILSANDRTSVDYAQTMTELQDIVIELTGANKDLGLSVDFVEKNLDKIEEAAAGSAEAIQALGAEVAIFQINSLTGVSAGMKEAFGSTKTIYKKVKNDFKALTIDGAEDASLNPIRLVPMQIEKTTKELENEFEAAKEVVSDGIEYLQGLISNGDLSIGDILANTDEFNFDDWITQINKVATAAQMSREELLSMFETMGMSVEPDDIILTDMTVKETVPEYSSTITPNADNTGFTMTTYQSGVQPVEYTKQFATLKEKPHIKYSGSGSVAPTAPKANIQKPESMKSSDMVDRYKEIDDSLADVADRMDDASKAADRLYGSARLAEMKKVNRALQDEIGLLKAKKNQIATFDEEGNLTGGYLKTDLDNLLAAAQKAGLNPSSLAFDEMGNITNYTTMMDELVNKYNQSISGAGSYITQSEADAFESQRENIEAFKEAAEQYDDTKELLQEMDNEMRDAFYAWQDNNYEQLAYTLEVNLELNEESLQKLEYYINKLEGDFNSMAEALALYIGSKEETYRDSENKPHAGGQLGLYLENLELYKKQKEDLDKKFGANQISQADYVAGLKEIQDGIYDNLESIQELDKMMIEYYGETLAAANEEIDKYIERMQHQTNVIEHYISLMDILGKSNDYKMIGKMLEAQSKTLEDQAEVAKKTMIMMQEQAEARRIAYEAAIGTASEELYKKQYEDALAAAQEAQDAYLSSAEEWAESLKSILENKLADLGQSLEDALTGGTSFDQLSTSMERAASLQEEYLTSTNKIYETTKMMRTAQQEIDKTTNSVAKQKLAGFIQETKQMQNQSKLSKYELDIQQAKYDLLLAELALEESKNAKSTVRLQRDSEGNFGYVYTADNNAIAEATQKYEDAQNALYNIGLEGTTDYAQKYQQTLNEMYDTITDLQNQYLEGSFSNEEEYNKAVQAAKEYYYAKLEEYSTLYSIAMTTDNQVVADSWAATSAAMINDTERWKDTVDDYAAQAANSFIQWKSAVNEISLDTGLSTISGQLSDIVEQSKALATQLTGKDGVIAGLETEIGQVVEATTKYGELKSALDEATLSYEDIAEAAREAGEAQAWTDEDPTFLEKNDEETKDYAQEYADTLASMDQNTADWKAKLAEYIGDVELDFQDWTKVVDEVSTEITNDLKTVLTDMGSVVTITETLTKTIGDQGGLTDAVKAFTKEVQIANTELGTQINKLTSISTHYGTLRNQLSSVASAYDRMAASARAAAAAAIAAANATGGSVDSYTPSTNYYGGGGGGGGRQATQVAFDDGHRIPGFDTGGYTGSWGSYGKLAMVHEKELILNEGDTENFLTGMGILDSILKMIDLQSASAQIGGLLSSPGLTSGAGGALEQSVHIEANFPNVQDRNEIEDAFNNLINRASQYANRK